MPLYEFICEKCGYEFEEMKRISQRDEPEPCPECGSPAQRQISETAVGGSSGGGGYSGGGGGCAPSG